MPVAISYADWDIATPDEAVYKQLRKEQGDAWEGLNAPIGAQATAAYHPRMDLDSNFTYEEAFRAKGAPTTSMFFGDRWNAASSVYGEQVWRARLTAARTVTFEWRTAGNASRSNTTAAAIPGAWNEDLGLRTTYDWDGPSGTNASVTIWYSLNPLAANPTWTLLETMSVGVAAHMAIGPQPLKIGLTTATSAVDRYVYYARLKDGAGSIVAEAPFSTLWPRGASSYTDAAGNPWSISGGATVGHMGGDWVTDEFGFAGPRMGYNPGSNYIAGVSYPDPAYDENLILARRNSANTESAVEEWRIVNGEYEARVLLTSANHLVRPMLPKGGGPTPLISEITRYDGYTSYEGNTRRVPR